MQKTTSHSTHCLCLLFISKTARFLLEQHYGLSLNDMFYQDEQVITQQIEQGTPVISTKIYLL
ncbi:hypothetical protein H0I61_08915 [Yersinia kristensenii]|nr:hypothetical protein [Yersinia kristensenii]MBW5829391.1 hypothetical protein [Yersinia kristensenii]